MKGVVYFVQEDHSGPIKIGYTEGSAEGRLSAMQIGNPRRLQLIAEIRGCCRDDEKRWHNQFAELRFVGEWFHPTSGLLAEILRCAEAPKCLGRDAPGGLKASLMDNFDRRGWISPQVRKQLWEKKREGEAA